MSKGKTSMGILMQSKNQCAGNRKENVAHYWIVAFFLLSLVFSLELPHPWHAVGLFGLGAPCVMVAIDAYVTAQSWRGAERLIGLFLLLPVFLVSSAVWFYWAVAVLFMANGAAESFLLVLAFLI